MYIPIHLSFMVLCTSSFKTNAGIFSLLFQKRGPVVYIHALVFTNTVNVVCFQLPDAAGYVGFANLPNQVHRKSVKKGFEFTLMVVGEWSRAHFSSILRS